MDILVIGILAAALQTALAVAFLWRKQTRRFPLFFAYTLFSICAITLNVAMRGDYNLYFLSSVATELVYGILALLAIREAYRHALDSFYVRYSWSRMVPPILLVAVIAIPLWRCFHHPSISGVPVEACLYSAAFAFQLCVAGIEVLVLFTFLYLTWAKQYRWRRYNKAILGGFGLYGLFSILSVGLGAVLHLPFESWMRYLSPGAYFGVTVLWLVAFLSEGDSPISKRPPDERQLDGIGTALGDYLRDLHGRKGE